MKDYLKSLNLISKLVLIYSVLIIIVSSISDICSLIYCICVDYTSSAPRILFKIYTLIEESDIFIFFTAPAILSPSYVPIITIVSMIMTITLIVNICVNINNQIFEEHLLKPILLSLLNPSVATLIFFGIMGYIFANMGFIDFVFANI